MTAKSFILTIDGGCLFCYPDDILNKMLVVTHGRSPPSGLCRSCHFSGGASSKSLFLFYCCTYIVNPPVKEAVPAPGGSARLCSDGARKPAMGRMGLNAKGRLPRSARQVKKAWEAKAGQKKARASCGRGQTDFRTAAAASSRG